MGAPLGRDGGARFDTVATRRSPTSDEVDTGPAVVALRDVTVRYGRRTVLDRVSLAVAGGEILALRGRNGSGKTTLLRVLANVARPAGGCRTGPATCAWVPAALEPPSVAAGAWLDGLPRRRPGDRRAALERLGFDGDLGAGCRTLSFGNLRKLVLAEALTAGQSLVLVDEVSAGLDTAGLDGLSQLVEAVAAAGTAVVLADQDSRPLPLAHRSVRVVRGGLRSGGEAAGDEVVEVLLEGPAARVGDLWAAAHRLGFRPAAGDGVGGGAAGGGAHGGAGDGSDR